MLKRIKSNSSIFHLSVLVYSGLFCAVLVNLIKFIILPIFFHYLLVKTLDNF